MSTETVSEAVDRLSAAGYTDDFRAEPEGLRAVGTGCVHRPESLTIDEIVRFEGASDPDDEAIVFALRCEAHHIKGTYAVPYGINLPEIDAEMVQRLTAKRL
jgi:hypothetical protein